MIVAPLQLDSLVGGIYTVLRTKAAETVREFGNQYYLVGVFSHRKTLMEVELKEPECERIRSVLRKLEPFVKVYTGKWLIDGCPNVILFDLGSISHRLSEWRSELWDRCKIPCPSNDTEMNDAILLGYGLFSFMNEVEKP